MPVIRRAALLSIVVLFLFVRTACPQAERRAGRISLQAPRNEYICAGLVPGRPALARKASINFGADSWLRVRITDQTKTLTPSARLTLANQIGETMGVWRRVCIHCVVGNLSVIKIDRDTFLDSTLTETLRSGDLDHVVHGPPSQAPNTTPGKRPVFIDVIEALLASRYGTRTPTSRYEELSSGDFLYTNVCSSTFENLPVLFQNIRLSLDCREDARRRKPQAATLALYLLNGTTSCGSNKAIVGCSADELVVELNAREYRYTDGQANVFGAGQNPVELFEVIINELGPWIGLVHNPHNGSIMYPAVSGARCITDDDILALDSLVGGERERHKGKGALYFAALPADKTPAFSPGKK
jgi:hypothetical protein